MVVLNPLMVVITNLESDKVMELDAKSSLEHHFSLCYLPFLLDLIFILLKILFYESNKQIKEKVIFKQLLKYLKEKKVSTVKSFHFIRPKY